MCSEYSPYHCTTPQLAPSESDAHDEKDEMILVPNDWDNCVLLLPLVYQFGKEKNSWHYYIELSCICQTKSFCHHQELHVHDD